AEPAERAEPAEPAEIQAQAAPAPAPGPAPDPAPALAPTDVPPSGPQPIPVAGTTPRPQSVPALALLLRGVGCFALIWAGTMLPYNYIREWHGNLRELLISATALVVALVNTSLRPRWPVAPAWLLFVVVNLALFMAVALIWPIWGLLGVLCNALLLGTACWALWWSVPGSRSR
ncbi:hypothetical protein J7E98_34585, partial [Streptomyces sp. ISL-86]|nr:hypothetical protein [Streptomyces sp. ISL-86]